MNTGYILISEHSVLVFPFNGEIWLTAYQIAELFEVFPSAVNSNIKSICKKGILNISEVQREHSCRNRITELYNFRMIVALAYYLSSRKAELFRKWIHETICFPEMPTISSCSNLKLN